MTNETATNEPLFFIQSEDGKHAVMTAAEATEELWANSFEIATNGKLATLTMTLIEDGDEFVFKFQQAVIADENIPARHVVTRDGINYTTYQVWHLFGAEDVEATPAYKN